MSLVDLREAYASVLEGSRAGDMIETRDCRMILTSKVESTAKLFQRRSGGGAPREKALAKTWAGCFCCGSERSSPKKPRQ